MRIVHLLVIAALALFCARANAAAFYLGEITATAQSRGGANMVNPGDATAMWLNPAALAHAKGLQLRVDNALIFLGGTFTRDCGANNNCGPANLPTRRNYKNGVFNVDTERSSPNDNIAPAEVGGLGRFNTPSNFGDGHSVSNQAAPQYVPDLWLSFAGDLVGAHGFAIGAAAFAPYAGDYAFDRNEYTRYTLIDRDLLELFYGVTFAYRYAEWFSVGVSLQGALGGVKQTIALSGDRFGNENPDADILVEIDTVMPFTPSANAGVWMKPIATRTGGLELGASMQLPRYVSANGPLRIIEKGPEIQALEQSGVVEILGDNGTTQANFTLPPFYRAGAKWVDTDVFGDGFLGYDIEANFVYEQWSSYDHVALVTDGIEFAFAGGDPLPLEPVIQPKDWNDAWSVRLGGEVDLFEERLTIRAGGFYETSAIPTETLSIDLLNGEKVGLGVGVGAMLYGIRVDVGYAKLFVFDRVVGDESIVYNENPVGGFNAEPRTRTAMGTYSIDYDVLTLALTLHFDEWFN